VHLHFANVGLPSADVSLALAGPGPSVGCPRGAARGVAACFASLLVLVQLVAAGQLGVWTGWAAALLLLRLGPAFALGGGAQPQPAPAIRCACLACAPHIVLQFLSMSIAGTLVPNPGLRGDLAALPRAVPSADRGGRTERFWPSAAAVFHRVGAEVDGLLAHGRSGPHPLLSGPAAAGPPRGSGAS